MSISLGQTNSFEWGTPVLYMRCPDGVLFRPIWETDETPREARRHVFVCCHADNRPAAEKLKQPIVGQGPFVMNTREEIQQAMRDYQAGRMGHLS